MRVVTTSGDNTVRLDVPSTAELEKIAQISPAVLVWTRAVAGLRFRQDGELEVIPEDERRKILQETELPLGPWTELAAWLKTSTPNRTLSLRSKVTLWQMAERERDFGSRASLGIGATVL